MLSDGFVWKQLLRWQIQKNHRPLVQWACVIQSSCSEDAQNRSWRFFMPSEATFTTPQQQHCFECLPAYIFLTWKKIWKINHFLSFLTLSLWSMIRFQSKEKPGITAEASHEDAFTVERLLSSRSWAEPSVNPRHPQTLIGQFQWCHRPCYMDLKKSLILTVIRPHIPQCI